MAEEERKEKPESDAAAMAKLLAKPKVEKKEGE